MRGCTSQNDFKKQQQNYIKGFQEELGQYVASWQKSTEIRKLK